MDSKFTKALQQDLSIPQDDTTFQEEPALRISSESKEARFFTKEEVKNLEIPVTHSDIVEECFLNL